MTSEESTSPFEFTPFPRHSVNLLTGPTSVGKTTYIKQLLENRKIFFTSPITRIVIVLCNERIQQIPLHLDEEEVSVEQIPLSEYHPDILKENDLVVIDDIQKVTESIRLTISVCAHHYNLASLFVVSHSILHHGNFELLSIVHRVFLFLRASSNTRLSKYLLSHFFQEPEVKEALLSTLNFCIKEGEVLAIELNSPASTIRDKLKFFAFSHLTQLIDKKFCFIYPTPQASMDYTNSNIHLRVDPDIAQDFIDKDIPKYALVAVPVSSIQASKKIEDIEEKKPACSKKQEWTETMEVIEDLIESYFKTARWRDCKNVAKEILTNTKLCVYTNGKYFQWAGKPHTKAKLLDFLSVVTRPGNAKEPLFSPKYKLYRQYVQEIKNSGSIESIFRNKLL